MGVQIGTAPLQIRMENHQKAKDESTTQPSYIVPRHTPKGFNIVLHTLVMTATLFRTVRKWKQPKCPSRDEWITRHIDTLEY